MRPRTRSASRMAVTTEPTSTAATGSARIHAVVHPARVEPEGHGGVFTSSRGCSRSCGALRLRTKRDLLHAVDWFGRNHERRGASGWRLNRDLSRRGADLLAGGCAAPKSVERVAVGYPAARTVQSAAAAAPSTGLHWPAAMVGGSSGQLRSLRIILTGFAHAHEKRASRHSRSATRSTSSSGSG